MINLINNLTSSEKDRVSTLEQRRKIINSISPSFCSAKWLQTTLYLQNGYNHSCHHPSPHKIPVSEVIENPAALSNSKQKKQARKQMLYGVRPDECEYCWKIEDIDDKLISDRYIKTSDDWSWDRVEEISELDWDQDVYPSYLEVSFSNVCNFKCSYCSPDLSSMWLEEVKQYGPYPTSSNTRGIDYLKHNGRYPYKHSEYNPYIEAFEKWFPEAYKHLKVLRITGGEPLLSKETWKMLDFIIDNPNTNLQMAINSNLSVDDKFIDKLILFANNFPGKLTIYTSLESIGAKAEYSRFGLDFEMWNNNVRKILEQTNLSVVVMTTVNILSVTSTIDYINHIVKLRQNYKDKNNSNRIRMSISLLRYPPYLDIKILPEKIKKSLSNTIMQTANNLKNDYQISIDEYNQILRMCSYLDSFSDNNEVKQKDFVKFINEYDKRKLTNFKKVFPELSNLMEIWQ